jgi:ligand-binding sensor domain-containing protein/signal transduction histidine kinase
LPPGFQHDFARDIWRSSDGLPEDTIQALAEGRDGRLWIGTTGGVATFDGLRTRPAALDAHQMSVNSAFCLIVAHDGSIWVGTEGGGVLHLASGSITTFSTAEGLTDGFVRSLVEDRTGRIWIGTDNGLFRWQLHKPLLRIDNTAAIAPIAVHSIVGDAQQNIWVGGSRLISIDPSGTAHPYALPGEYSETRVKRILQTADGTIYVGTVGGLARMEHGRFERVRGIGATVRTLLQSSDGTLWIGTIGDGLWAMRDGQAFRAGDMGLLPSATILALLEDSYGQIWVGTQVGLVRLSRTPVTILHLPDGSDSDFETLSGDAAGRMFVAARQLFTIEHNVLRPASLPLPPVSVRNVFVTRSGTLWVGTDGSGAYNLSGRHVTHYSAPRDLTNNFVRAFLETRRGDIWIATDEGVSVITNHGTRKLTESSGLAYFSTRCLLEDRSNTLWIGTDRGLSAFRNNAFVQNAATTRMAQEKIWSMLEDRTGALWFGTRDHGLYRYKDGQLHTYTVDQGLPSNSIYQMLQTADGMFWMTGPNTIAAVTEASLDAPWDAARSLSVTTYSMPYGAEGAQLYGGREPAGYIAPDQSVWFPTNRGVARVAPDPAIVTGPPPHALVDSILEDGRSVPVVRDLRVPSSVARLSIGISAVYLRAQSELHFRYRLEGFDTSWINATSRETATYTNLHPGKYTFRLEAFDASHPDAVDEAVVTIHQGAHFYQTGSFVALCVCVLLLLGWLAYQLRVRRLRIGFAAVMEERSRLAREMHDTVIQSCTGVSALLEALSITPASHEASASQLLDMARQQTRRTIDTARDVVWNIRHAQENEIELIAAIRHSLGQLARESAEIALEAPGLQSVPLPASRAHEVIMTIREAVYNSLQHSGSNRVEVHIREARNRLEIDVRDFGHGADADALATTADGHYGILGMRERIRKVDGEFSIVSRLHEGTTVHLRVPLVSTSRKSPV